MLQRAMLSVPAGSPERFAKAVSSGASAVLLDLEDAVVPAAKAEARAAVVEFLADAAPRPPLVVRVNAARTPWCHEDVLAVATAPGPDRLIMLPKVESAADLAFLERLIDGAEAATGVRRVSGCVALVETARGLRDADRIAMSSPRLVALAVGYADLAADLGRPPGGSGSWAAVRDRVVVAARAGGLGAIDGPHLGTAVDDAFFASLEASVGAGFDGAWVLHPRQVAAAEAAFTPPDSAVLQAHAVLDALQEAASRGLGVVDLDGRMIDEAVAVHARRVLARGGADDVSRS